MVPSMTSSISAPSPVLGTEDIEHFLAHGFVHLTGCFDISPGSQAHRWIEESWARNGVSPDDPSAWPMTKIHMPVSESAPVRDFSPRAFAAISELCGGEDRVAGDLSWGNGFIANYGLGRDKEWLAPGPEADDWHVDGDFFLHFLDSAEQALLVLFSDLQPKGGGTFIACDSVPAVARYLADHPEGINPYKFPNRELIKNCRDFREVTGQPGDVILVHPFMLHSSSYNHRPVARLMINPPAMLRAPMRLDRRSDGSAYSLVERGILRALGTDHHDFRPTRPRERLAPARFRELAAMEK
jgi:hypothetical protein